MAFRTLSWHRITGSGHSAAAAAAASSSSAEAVEWMALRGSDILAPYHRNRRDHSGCNRRGQSLVKCLTRGPIVCYREMTVRPLAEAAEQTKSKSYTSRRALGKMPKLLLLLFG